MSERSVTRPVISANSRRISFVIEKLAQRGGGAERVLIETANSLQERGHQVEIISHEYRGRPPSYALVPGVVLSNLRPPNRPRLNQAFQPARNALHRLPDIRGIDHIVWLSRNGSFWRRLQAHLRNTRPDVVVAFMPPAISALAQVRVDHPMRRVASLHNAPEQDFNNPERWDPSALDRRRRLNLLSNIDRIAVLLPEYRDWFPEYLSDRISVMPNAVRPIAKPKLLDANRAHVVMSVGRLSTVKRHDLLLDSWALLTGAFPDWRLQIFGEGPLRGQLEEKIKHLRLRGSVTLMGHRVDINEAYLKSSVLAHPAEFEGFPLAVTEALASGLPVVGFRDCSGLNRLVQNGVNGLLVPDYGDRTDNYARSLAQVMGNDDLRTSLSAAGPDSVAQYSPKKVIDMWEDLLFAP